MRRVNVPIGNIVIPKMATVLVYLVTMALTAAFHVQRGHMGRIVPSIAHVVTSRNAIG